LKICQGVGLALVMQKFGKGGCLDEAKFKHYLLGLFACEVLECFLKNVFYYFKVSIAFFVEVSSKDGLDSCKKFGKIAFLFDH
jgi:hypothetical protein